MFNTRKIVWFLFLTFATVSSANARVYMCEDENGKKTATDSACKPTDKKREVKMRITETDSTGLPSSSEANGSTASDNKQGTAVDPKCEELLTELKNTPLDPSKQSFGELFTAKAKRSAITQEYELRCMSSSDRQANQAKRSNAQIQNQLNQIQIKQQEIQNRQRGYGY